MHKQSVARRVVPRSMEKKSCLVISTDPSRFIHHQADWKNSVSRLEKEPGRHRNGAGPCQIELIHKLVPRVLLEQRKATESEMKK